MSLVTNPTESAIFYGQFTPVDSETVFILSFS